jgi:TolA-binding protein
LLVAAIIAVATGAGAAAWYLVLAPLIAPRQEPLRPATNEPSGLNTSPVLPAPAATLPDDETPDRRARVRRAPVVFEPAEGSAAPAPEPSAPEVPATVPPFSPQRTTGPVSSTPPSPPASAFSTALPVPLETSAQLFAQANDLRRSGEYVEAARVYRELQASFPGSREETSSRVTLGRLLLDRLGDVAGALAQFDAYLASAPDGTLAEETLVGRALALQRLGRAVEERAAWTVLLARYPTSANAERARGRLEELMHETR